MAVVCEGQIEEIHVGDIGTDLELTIKECVDGVIKVVDVSGATTKEIIFKRGDSSIITKPADFVTDGKDGKIHYISVLGDIQSAGEWQMQGKVTGIASWSGKSSVEDFIVYGNLDD